MRRILILSTLAVLLTLQASAGVDPDPDGVGVYFDIDAETVHLSVDPLVIFEAYVILTNPSANQLEAFEFYYEFVAPPGMEGFVFRLSYVFPDCPNCIVFIENEIIVGLPAPVSLNNPHVLMVQQFMLLAPLEGQFFLGPLSGGLGQLAYYSEGEMIIMHPSSGSPDLPVAMVNGEGVVPVEKTTLGSLKALFR
jgi:hypothetical protein